MSRLPIIDPATAEGKAKDLLATVQQRLGATPNMTKALANSPAALEAYLGLSGALGRGALKPAVREQFALAVAEANGCEYCLAAHTYIGKNLTKLDDQEIASSRRGESRDPKVDAALKFASTVVETRGAVTDADVDAVRAAGYGDGEIAEIVAHVALNVLTNYFNNVANVEIDFPAAPALV